MPWKKLILENTQATDVCKLETVQSLWSGYGEIFRARLSPEEQGTVIVKQITPTDQSNHPRGWNTSQSEQRKLKSYQVESHWYEYWAQHCSEQCRVPSCIATQTTDQSRWIVMEDLDAIGFDTRYTALTVEQAKPCLSWLANFHARFLNQTPEGLWPVGTYWQLETRPDEYQVMADDEIKRCAVALDRLLNSCKYKTLVHGDAKVANFCFDKTNNRVAAVDFQYVGGGCGIKDVAYFFGSCFDEDNCERNIPALLDYYFIELAQALRGVDFNSLEKEWRKLFAPAWTDFYRFLLGWMPPQSKTHAKIHRYTKQLAQQTLLHPALQ